MVNTRTDAELAAAVQAAVDAMLPQIREQVREEYRAGASGSNTPPVTIHTWLERFNKQKPLRGDAVGLVKAYKQAQGGDAVGSQYLTWQLSQSSFFLQVSSSRARALEERVTIPSAKGRVKIVLRYKQLSSAYCFLDRQLQLQKNRRRNFSLGTSYKSIRDHVMCIQFTDVAQVADAGTRTIEILRDREDYDRSDVTDKRAWCNYRNNNNNNYSRDNTGNSVLERDQRNRGQQSQPNYQLALNQFQQVPGTLLEVILPCLTTHVGRRHPGECPSLLLVTASNVAGWSSSAVSERRTLVLVRLSRLKRSPTHQAVSLHLRQDQAAITSGVPSRCLSSKLLIRMALIGLKELKDRVTGVSVGATGSLFARMCIAMGCTGNSVCQEEGRALRQFISKTSDMYDLVTISCEVKESGAFAMTAFRTRYVIYEFLVMSLLVSRKPSSNLWT
ncbi:hypothetical protein Tco_1361087 [Tanacetum coccineum]